MNCCDEDTLLRFVQGHTSESERKDIEEHLDGCQECRAVVGEASRLLAGSASSRGAGEPASPPSEPLAAGTRVSRYEIVDVIGVGGAGVVYRAYDPELRRSIALKLIRPDSSSTEARGAAAGRLLREAQAMAQLAHPNVVGVYDAGTYEGEVFLVMELVDGTTLAEWLHSKKPGWKEILAVFLDAGRGLGAAHRANLVHRDFKPENVLIGTDGRVRVTDFGLARPPATGAFASGGGGRIEKASPPVPTAPATFGGNLSPASAITRLAGTPAFMAPEQFRGDTADARTDQFSFCVALYLALYRQHPFGFSWKNAPRAGLAELVTSGRVLPPPPGTGIPEGLRAVLLRGLSAASEARFPAIEDLLDALAPWRRPFGKRLRRAAFALLPLGVAAMVAGGWLLTPAGQEWRARLMSECGNAVLEAGEECDDGNRSESDGCLPACRMAACGDGRVRAGVEECDDGNRIDGDGCSLACLGCRHGDASFSWGTDGHCFSRIDTPANFETARKACGKMGGDLATTTSEMEVVAIFDALFKSGVSPTWIGLVDSQKKGVFGWVTGEPTVEPSGPVDLLLAGRYCGALVPGRRHRTDSRPLHWEPKDCAAKASSLCEQPLWLLRPKGNHAYLLVSIPAPWHVAKTDCEKRGGHLATITDADEQAFVAAHTFSPVWLGALDAEAKYTFAWVTGEPFAFKAFNVGEPDERWVKPICLMLGKDEQWHDRGCHESFSYLCEID